MESAVKKTPLPISNKKAKLSLIHIAKKDVGVTDEDYRSILFGAAGVESAAELEYEYQFNAVMKAFENLGFKSTGGSNKLKQTDTKSKRNWGWISARQEYYIRGLWVLASRKKDEQSIRAIIKRIAKVDDIHFMQKKDATKVILALRDIAEKAGFDPDSRGALKKQEHC
jgi:hypothetical protein